MYSEQNRAFSYAVLASIVLHGMLLFGISKRERPIQPEPQLPIVARLVEPPAPARPEPARPESTPMVIPPEVRPPPVARPKPRPRAKAEAPKPVEKAAPAPRQEPAPPTEPPAVAQAPAASEAAVPSAAAAAQPAQPAEPVLDPRSVAEYRLQIIGAAPRYKRYPRVARENNWEGLVALRMVFAPSGRLASLSVTKTSGYDVLDKQAAQMFRSAAEAVPVPPLLRGKEFAVEVAAVYDLTD